MLRHPISAVVSEAFIPSVPCCVIVISLQGPTSTDEVSLTRQSHCSGPRPGLPGSPQAGNPKPQTSKLETLLDEEDKIYPRCVLTNKLLLGLRIFPVMEWHTMQTISESNKNNSLDLCNGKGYRSKGHINAPLPIKVGIKYFDLFSWNDCDNVIYFW